MWGDTATRVLLAVLTQDRPTVRSVAAEVGRSVSNTHRYLVKLRAAGLVKWEDDMDGTLCPMVAAVPGSMTERVFGDILGSGTSDPRTVSAAGGLADTGRRCRHAEQ